MNGTDFRRELNLPLLLTCSQIPTTGAYTKHTSDYSWQAIWGLMQYCNFCLGADSHLTGKSQTPAFKISVTHRLLFSFTGASSDLFVSRGLFSSSKYVH